MAAAGGRARATGVRGRSRQQFGRSVQVYFMLEKLVMTGGIRLLRVYSGDFFLANTVAITVVTFMLCLLVARRPSKTGPRAATAAPRTLDPVLTAPCTLR